MTAVRDVIEDWLADVDDALEDEPGAHDAYVRLGARWVGGNYQERLEQAMIYDRESECDKLVVS